MSLRSTAIRLGIAAAGGALTALAATSPAVASDIGHDHGHGHHAPVYKGRVTAHGGLLLRDAPTRGSAVIRSEPYGAVVPIYCKTVGENVGGNHLWYLLTDGTWAWGAARYIDNIGQAPRWC